MKSTSSLLLATLCCASSAFAQTYHLEGMIVDGAALFPDAPFDPNDEFGTFGDPPSGYPIEYTATLVIGDPITTWSFNFTANDSGMSTGGVLASLGLSSSRGYDNNVIVSNELISIDYFLFSTFGQDFQLDFTKKVSRVLVTSVRDVET